MIPAEQTPAGDAQEDRERGGGGEEETKNIPKERKDRTDNDVTAQPNTYTFIFDGVPFECCVRPEAKPR